MTFLWVNDFWWSNLGSVCSHETKSGECWGMHEQVDGGWQLNGQKRWIGNSTFADVAIIFARNTRTNQINGSVLLHACHLFLHLLVCIVPLSVGRLAVEFPCPIESLFWTEKIYRSCFLRQFGWKNCKVYCQERGTWVQGNQDREQNRFEDGAEWWHCHGRCICPWWRPPAGYQLLSRYQ